MLQGPAEPAIYSGIAGAVEVRVVLQKVTVARLVETCSWLARNLPFVDHVALMGLENTGFALANQDLLWVRTIARQNVLEVTPSNPLVAHVTNAIRYAAESLPFMS